MTDEDVEAVRRAIVAMTEGREESLRARVIEEETALFLSLPMPRRREVAARLITLSELPNARTVEDVDRAAKRIGVERSNVYRLLKRVETLGPVSGLVPGRRAAPRPSAARDGFGEPIDGWIDERLRERPDASMAEVQRMIESRVLALPATAPDGSRLRVPPPSAVQRRVHALRAAGIRKPIGQASTGAAMIIDYCPLNAILTSTSRSGERRMRRANAVVIVDVPTSFVLGAGLFADIDLEYGIEQAVRHMVRDGIPSLADAGIRIASRPERIRWRIPRGMLDVVRQVVRVAEASDPPVRIDADHGASGRPGLDAHRMLGRSLGEFRFRPRRSLRAAECVEDFVGTADLEIEGLDMANRVFGFAAVQRNLAMIASMDENDGPRRRARRQDDAIASMTETMRALFASVQAVWRGSSDEVEDY
ncbi:hypothetical protein [Sphingomonas panni]|uniref:hypothetical protein n=1 Tax=Sphingomonas panni TaxID=237612 RepID=UPI001F5BE828|nr:hypothetical protein [Sphingomonas panni]